MLSLIIAGVVMIAAGSLITAMKYDRRLGLRFKGVPVMEKISSRIGFILFVAGLLCVIAGVANLYYA
jgi:hypothetical protein